MTARFEFNDVRIERAGMPIVDGISANLSAGTALIIRGPNGAGKSTLLKASVGNLPLAAGTITFRSDDGEHAAPEIGERAHSVGHQNAVSPVLTVRENLRFLARFLGGDPAGVDAAMERLALTELADIPTKLLSAGQKRRAGLARLLTAQRPIWLLDEPTTSLDTASSGIVSDLVNEHLAEGGIAVIATHIDLAIASAATLTLAPAPPRDLVDDLERAGWAGLEDE